MSRPVASGLAFLSSGGKEGSQSGSYGAGYDANDAGIDSGLGEIGGDRLIGTYDYGSGG